MNDMEMEYQKQFIEQEYGITIIRISPIQSGVGGETYKIESNVGKLVFKVIGIGGMNHPELEPVICETLSKENIAVPSYLSSTKGEKVIKYSDESVCHLQTYIDGTHYAVHTAPQWLMKESARVLGRIHSCLEKEKDFPMGIGRDFFTYMTPDTAVESYRHSLELAKQQGDTKIIEDLKFRIHLLSDFPKFQFDTEKLTYCNTHGDYTINQLVCGTDTIEGVVDWTCACRQPVIWEVIRSFLYAEPSCREGNIEKEKLLQYVKIYMSEHRLNTYDIKQILNLYYYQIAVCDYYSQYLNGKEEDKKEFLWQAQFATKMLKFLSENIIELNQYLEKMCSVSHS